MMIFCPRCLRTDWLNMGHQFCGFYFCHVCLPLAIDVDGGYHWMRVYNALYPWR